MSSLWSIKCSPMERANSQPLLHNLSSFMHQRRKTGWHQMENGEILGIRRCNSSNAHKSRTVPARDLVVSDGGGLYVCGYPAAKPFAIFFISKGFRTVVFIFIVISTTFWPICPPAFFRCLSNSRTYTELRTTSFIISTGVVCSYSVSHNWIQVLSIPVLLLTCNQDWTCNLQMIVSFEVLGTNNQRFRHSLVIVVPTCRPSKLQRSFNRLAK